MCTKTGASETAISEHAQAKKASHYVNDIVRTYIIYKLLTFNDPTDDSTRPRATMKCLEEVEHQLLEREPKHIKSEYKMGVGTICKEYKDMCNVIKDQVQNEVGTWHLCKVLNHRSVGPSQRKNYQVMIKWASGEHSFEFEPLSAMYTADTYLLTKYDKEQISFPRIRTKVKEKKLAANSNRLPRLVDTARLTKLFNSAPVCMNGPKVPCKHQEAMDLGRKDRNNNRTESETMETLQPLGYKASKNFGLKSNAVAPRPTKMIALQFMYAVIVPICNHIALFEDNKTIIDNTPKPDQRLRTRHVMLSCYYLQEALASGDYVYLFVNGKYNQFVVLCTHWILRGAYQEPERHVNIVSSDRYS